MPVQKKLVSRKKLEMLLQNLQSFKDPKPSLEQYPITPAGASLILSIIANTYNDIFDKIIADLGCGTGILAIGTALLGAKQVIGVDIDQKQLEIATKNAELLDVAEKIKWLKMDIRDFSIKVDVIIQNPPFGVQNRGADVIFLTKAIENAEIIYSIHNSSEKIRKFLSNVIQKQNAYIDAIIPIQIRIPHLFKFHKKKYHLIQVDLYRILRTK